MDKTVLNEGISELYVARDILLQLQEDKDKKVNLDIEEEKLEKVIVLREKQMNDEVSNTLKVRKEEIEETYNNQINELKSKLKKIKTKKEKSKSKKVSERIVYETEELRDENHQVKQEIRKIMKESKLPAISNNNLFYSLFMPKGLNDFLHIFLTLFVMLFILPCSIYFFLLTTQKLIYLVIIYLIIVVVIAIAYMLIENNVKDKYHDKLKEIRILKYKLKKNMLEQNRVKRGIKRDKDESIYELEDFDKEINFVNQEINNIINQKEEAMLTFDKQTKQLITDEIKLSYKSELEEMNQILQLRIKERKALEEKITMSLLHYTGTYEVYLGKEFMKIESLDKLVQLMEEKKLSTVSEGLTHYKNEK